jgi:hypothetical protein
VLVVVGRDHHLDPLACERHDAVLERRRRVEAPTRVHVEVRGEGVPRLDDALQTEVDGGGPAARHHDPLLRDAVLGPARRVDVVGAGLDVDRAAPGRGVDDVALPARVAVGAVLRAAERLGVHVLVPEHRVEIAVERRIDGTGGRALEHELRGNGRTTLRLLAYGELDEAARRHGGHDDRVVAGVDGETALHHVVRARRRTVIS